jgi:hypothetical protein
VQVKGKPPVEEKKEEPKEEDFDYSYLQTER